MGKSGADLYVYKVDVIVREKMMKLGKRKEDFKRNIEGKWKELFFYSFRRKSGKYAFRRRYIYVLSGWFRR